jgi:archaellin
VKLINEIIIDNSGRKMSKISLVSCFLTISTVIINVNILGLKPLEALELSNKQTAFTVSPRLIDSVTSIESKNSPLATYKFTIAVPKNARESLKAVKIVQKNKLDLIIFKEDRSRAFLGNRLAGNSLPVTSTVKQSRAGEITLVFDSAIEPGNTVTIAIKPKRNPSFGGVYLFGVTAYPTGKNSLGLYLGSASIHISQN